MSFPFCCRRYESAVRIFPFLVTRFVERICRKLGKRVDRIAPATMSAFEAYDWPGNVCELQNLIERAVILADGGVLPNPLPLSGTQQVITAPPLAPTFRESERALILNALETVGWVIGGAHGAATRLGLNRTTLINKMKKLGITRPVPHRLGDRTTSEVSIHGIEGRSDERRQLANPGSCGR